MQNMAPKGGASSDAPTGPSLWQARPVGYLWDGSVRTDSSNGEGIDSCDHQPEAPLNEVVA